jgi:hypothetical protein
LVTVVIEPFQSIRAASAKAGEAMMQATAMERINATKHFIGILLR